MHLILASQDISEITVGLYDGETLVEAREFSVAPEEHLQSVDVALHEWNCPRDTLKGVVVVTGPGSFTASRVSVTIANAIAWTLSLPVFGVENPERQELSTRLSTVDLDDAAQRDFAVPAYNRPPMTT